MIENNLTLTSLSLYKNQIGNTGSKAIGMSLKVNSSLTKLMLGQRFSGGNNIGDTGVTAIGHALKENSTLKELHLSHNKIENIGADAIITGLKENKTLQKIHLNGNNFSEKSKKTLQSVANAHESIRESFF